MRYLLLFALACFFLMPVYALLVTALKSPSEVSVVRMWEWPHSLSLDNFRIVWPKLREGFTNSVLMAVPASMRVVAARRRQRLRARRSGGSPGPTSCSR